MSCSKVKYIRTKEHTQNWLLSRRGTSKSWHSEETKQKIRETKKNNPCVYTEEYKKKMSEMKMGHFVSEETKVKQSTSMLGHTVSDETKQKIRSTLRARYFGKIVKRKPHTEERKRNISISKTGKPQSKESNLKRSLALSGPKSHLWRGGISFEPYPLGWNRIHREQIRNRDGYKCQLCGVHEVECSRRLHVHHIDYNKENIDPKNLISLCLSCHMKTNYNREYWITYFYRKEYINVK